MKLELYRGQVIDTADPDKLGLLKIRVLPQMNGVPDRDLLWFKPFVGLNNEVSKHHKPAVNSYVWCLIDKHWRELHYLTNYSVEKIFDFSTVESDLGAVSELSDTSYNNLNFELFEDGSILFHNISTSERGFLYKSGSYFIHKNNGDFISDNGGFKVIVKNNKLTIDGETKSLVTHTELNTALQTFVTALNLHVHPVASVGAPTGPPTPSASIDISNSRTDKIKTS